jgi:hypothetical protein
MLHTITTTPKGMQTPNNMLSLNKKENPKMKAQTTQTHAQRPENTRDDDDDSQQTPNKGLFSNPQKNRLTKGQTRNTPKKESVNI